MFEDSEDTEPRAVIPNVDYLGSEDLKIRLNANVDDDDIVPDTDSDTLKIDYVCLRSKMHPEISLNPTQFNFGAILSSPLSGVQTLYINNTGNGILNWTASPSANWIVVNPSSGSGNGNASVSVTSSGLSPGTYTGSITVSEPTASNSPQIAGVTLRIYEAGTTQDPFGIFETPTDDSTVMSSIPITGWVLDDIGVESVKIYRGQGKDLVYIGDGVFVEGARPDVEQAYPGYPMNYKAGWGYMMLTNFLPNGGNGTFKIHAIATDIEGHQITLGTKNILCDNTNAVKPFGAIDTPTQGGTASGNNFINWGWVLTPQPNSIPKDGSTINVYVDGVNLGHPTYNIYRSDIANFFPGYNNSDGATGYFSLDTTAYTNGVHTIQWTAKDSGGNSDGIGSRYFTIQNTRNSQSKTQTTNSGKIVAGQKFFHFSQIVDIPLNNSGSIRIKRGFRGDIEPELVTSDESGVFIIKTEVPDLLDIIVLFSLREVKIIKSKRKT